MNIKVSNRNRRAIRSAKKKTGKPVLSSRNIEILTFDELSAEQQDVDGDKIRYH